MTGHSSADLTRVQSDKMGKILLLLSLSYLCFLFNAWEQGKKSTVENVIHCIFESKILASNKTFLIITKCKRFMGHTIVLFGKLGVCAHYHLQRSCWADTEVDL